MTEASPVSLMFDASPVFDWREANEAVIGAGLRWIEARLRGEEGEAERAAYHAARTDMIAADQPAAIDRLSTAFALSPFEEDVLLLAFAPMIDGLFGPRYGAVLGRPNASPATPHLLALILCGGDRLPAEARARLSAEATLRARSLILLDAAAELPVGAAITLPARVFQLLSGIDEPDPHLVGLTRPLLETALPDRLATLAIHAAWSDPAPRLQLIGPPRSGRRALAVAILAQTGLGATAIDDALFDGAAIAPLMRDATLDACGLIVECEAGASPALKRLHRAWPGALVIVAERPLAGFEALPVVRLEPIDADERAILWRNAAPGLGPDEIARVAEQFALGPEEIAAVSRHPGLRAGTAWQTCRALGARDLEALAIRVQPERSWDDMVLAPETQAELAALAAQIEERVLVHGAWGYRRLLGRATGVSALFAGPSGVGKTMAAEAIAHALKLDLYVVDLPRVTSKFIGETEKNLARVFDAAESGGAVLFFDEADALFGKRSEVKDSHDRYANAEISYLLQRMERYGGLAILATNLKSHLDAAFLRRLRMIVDFPMPDVPARLALWRRALPRTAPLAGIEWQKLARIELTGGNITTIATNAAFRAAADGEPIGMTHLAAALAAEFRKLDREPIGLCG